MAKLLGSPIGLKLPVLTVPNRPATNPSGLSMGLLGLEGLGLRSSNRGYGYWLGMGAMAAATSRWPVTM